MRTFEYLARSEVFTFRDAFAARYVPLRDHRGPPPAPLDRGFLDRLSHARTVLAFLVRCVVRAGQCSRSRPAMRLPAESKGASSVHFMKGRFHCKKVE